MCPGSNPSADPSACPPACRYQQLFESELLAAEELTSIGEGALALIAWPARGADPAATFVWSSLQPVVSLVFPSFPDNVAAAQPGRDYVLRYNSQQAYETITGKLRMLREWRVGGYGQ